MMHEPSPTLAEPQRRRTPCARRSAAIGALAILAVAAACGGASSDGSTASSHPSAVAYSRCMRSHGVPEFPDPDSSGQLPKGDARRFGVSSSGLQAARRACRAMLPADGGGIDAASIQGCMSAGNCPPALVRRVMDEERDFAQCMRSRGVPNWPDPSIDSQGRPVFVISISEDGFDPYSRQVWAKGNACSHLMPGLPGLPAAVSP
jgi:hypothetical protein